MTTENEEIKRTAPRTLLPRSSTQIERAFDKTAAKYIEAIPVERISEQWDPQKCPAHLLGWLAWAVSVDDWDPSWDETAKRNVIAANMDVHRHKGTKSSISEALKGIGVSTEFIEWHDDPENDIPHSFRIKALINSIVTDSKTDTTANTDTNNTADANADTATESIINEKFYQDIKRQVDFNRPARSQFILQVGAEFNQTLSVNTTAHAVNVVRLSMEATQAGVAFNQQIAANTTTQASNVMRLNMETA